MKDTNKTTSLLRLSIKLDRISDMLLDQDRQDWILESVDEAMDDAVDLFILARQAKVT